MKSIAVSSSIKKSPFPQFFPANVHSFLSILRRFWREARQVRLLVYDDYVTN